MDRSATTNRALPGALDSIKNDWEEILDSNGEKSVFLSLDYLALWYRCFADEADIHILQVFAEGQSIGFWPLVKRRVSGKTILMGLTNSHCLHFAPLIRHGFEDRFFLHTMASLDKEHWDQLQLDWLHSYLRLCNYDLHRISGPFKLICKEDRNYTINLSSDFDTYFNSDLSAKMRKNLKMYRNKLAKSGNAAVRHLTGPEAVASFGEFMKIEDSGWKGTAGSSIARSAPEYQTYYHGLVELLARTNDLHMYFLDLDQKAIAAVFGYTEGDIFHYSKIGYREEYAKLSPSNLLLNDIIADIKANLLHIRKFHLFPEDTGYKHRWINEQSKTYTITIYSNSFRGRTSYLLAMMRNKLKEIEWLRRTVYAVRGMGKGE